MTAIENGVELSINDIYPLHQWHTTLLTAGTNDTKPYSFSWSFRCNLNDNKDILERALRAFEAERENLSAKYRVQEGDNPGNPDHPNHGAWIQEVFALAKQTAKLPLHGISRNDFNGDVNTTLPGIILTIFKPLMVD